MMYLLGIDIGTTSICCTLVDAEQRQVIRCLTKSNEANIISTRSWEKTQDPERIINIVNELLQAFKAEWQEVEAIGVSCQMHGILYLDVNGNHVSPLFTWQDERGEELFTSTHTYVSYLCEATGYTLLTGYGLVTHFYNMINGKVPKDSVNLCTIGDYITMKLCHSKTPLLDASNAASLGMFDLVQLNFDLAALEKIGLNRSMLPKLAGADMLVGLTIDNIPVICAIGDNQASFLGAVSDVEHTLLINLGTGSQASIYSKELIENAKLDVRPFPGGGYLLVGASVNGGRVYAELEAYFKEICLTFSRLVSHSIYDEMNRLALESLDEEKSNFHRESVDPSSNQANCLPSPKQMIHEAIYKIADELVEFVQLMPESLLLNLKAASGSGNGIRKNPAMRQLLQRKLNLPFIYSNVEEEAAFGAAIHAGVASGRYADYNMAD
jgi:sedoheptulokinase